MLNRNLTQEEIELWNTYTSGKSISLDHLPTKWNKFHSQHISRRLDLHGLSTHTAYNKLCEWLDEQIACENTEVVVITGKSGQISSEFKSWAKNIPTIKSFISLKDKKGEDGGSYRLYLKKSAF